MIFDTGVIMSLFYHFVVKTYLAALISGQHFFSQRAKFRLSINLDN
ncbi:hypothetical protein N480_17265 [Pseudoalteromonas luteoviolacea S2607]|uniref:Uncharacterized protein n=1 Tax=Pseudoalteromonas luteoviolacea S4060-1 TaxID=1365257 RepID=A0A167IKB9_9GAMM|nr:hypothetical protein N480_17265 [Pseudoalteromonas luteoviolacea S2607]KZN59650.1 hypothetical protein N478_08005 [Pseudoalteromonas luteoviolacea S4060-1]